jgi:glutamate synthase domain-containing protein 3
MSGGYAYVWDVDGRFEQRLNPNSNLELSWGLHLEDLELIYNLIARHVELTNSERGRMILQNWEDEKRRFAKVVSEEYKALLAKRAEEAARA